MPNTFTIAALFYGDFPHLADRLLGSFEVNLRRKRSGPPLLADIRLGLNSVSASTYETVKAFTEKMRKLGHTVYWYSPVVEKNEPTYKYPMMRRMLFGITPVTADYFVWFDDDSLMVEHPDWLGALEEELQGKTLGGIRYRSGVTRSQQVWIMDQPWAPTREPKDFIYFPQGSWWIAKTRFLLRWNYPFPELRHCGGDGMLGQLMRAKCVQDDVAWFPLVNEYARHNCDATFIPSSSKRRGFHELLLAKEYVGYPLPTDHQNIDYDIVRHQQGRVCYARDFGRCCHPEEPAEFSLIAERAAHQAAKSNGQQRVPEVPGADSGSRATSAAGDGEGRT